MPNPLYISNPNAGRELTDREKDILRTIIHLYILNASPIGSRNLSKYLEHELKLSPATIRNVMSDLEEMQYISHTHTSSGRVPTDKGYRFYVDTLMQIEALNEADKNSLKLNLTSSKDENILKDASKILGVLSKYLGIVEIPHLLDLIVQRIELFTLSSTRLLIVIALDSNIVRTVTLEAEFEIDNRQLENVNRYINEKIGGRKLKYIQDNFAIIVSNFDSAESPLMRLFVESIDRLFELQSSRERVHLAGTQNLLSYPEFEDLGRVRGVIELIENEDIIIHVLDKYEAGNKDIKILIGSELQNEILDDYSLVMSQYHIGSAVGSIGLIGPKRMNYSRMSSLVQYVAEIISK